MCGVEVGEIQQRLINAEANVSQQDVIRCLKDGCIAERRAPGRGERGRETEARARETQTAL